MKKIMLLMLFATFFAKAQNPEIFDKPWYIYYYWHTVLDNYSEADPCDDPLFIYFGSDGTFHGRSTCSEFTGNWTYDTDSQWFNIQNFQNIEISPCDNVCYHDPQVPPSNIDFYFLNYLTEVSDTECIVAIGVEGSSMVMDNCTWERLYFQDTPILSVPDVQKKVFSIHPNPVSSAFRISSPESFPINNWILYSNTGRKVHEALDSSSNSVDISHLRSGIYFIEIVSDQGREIHKIVKE
ncbi:T9SS type A sorting domain-containing protein [Aureisphaera galaxeae]|uniref:T9SS type A sorting domain-containing protein n=1 Tax=Aureisphaera galaxeae TaxID=1538023 RepID=UPI002350BE32|nr:T9SS type A sorting domain-containing protein [Aureisphaera galaxeae]MDC8002554.1 T9SS type A sorting domain-containing protein [Aureisphaera galaxeae]